MSLSGLTALVTGGGVNLGRQLALALGDAGADIVVCGRRAAPLEQAAAELVDRGCASARAVVADVTVEEERVALLKACGRVDVLVNNAGHSINRPWLEVTLEEWREVMTLNVEAPFRLCQLASPGMIERGWGRIVNVASVYASLAPDPARYPGHGIDVASYVTSKHALLGLSRHLAAVLGPTGVTVNALSPGMFILPESPLGDEAKEQLRRGAPVGRTGGDDDLHTAIRFLTARESGFVTGQDIVVDGGWSVW